MDEDIVDLEILDDGVIKATTNPISPANHVGAERFFKLMAELAGGEQERARRSAKHVHTHTHDHDHLHEGH